MTSRGVGLHAYDLHSIASAIEKLNASGIRVETAIIGQHRVTLEWHDSQGVRDPSYYTVTSIERAE